MNKDAITYNNNPKRKTSTVVIEMPGSGGQLLLELMALAGGTKVTGRQENSFYNAITVLVESISSNGNDYGPVESIAKGKNGLGFYGRDTKEFDTNLSVYCIKNLLLKTTSGAGLALVGTLMDGGENWVSRFCNAIRFMDEHDFASFRIAFLVCDLCDNPYSNPIEHNKQLQVFKDAMELGDMWIKKSDLLANPKQVMLKLKCHSYPNEDKVNQIMKKYATI